MKKLIALLLAMIMCLSLAACGQQEEAPINPPAPTEESTSPLSEPKQESTISEQPSETNVSEEEPDENTIIRGEDGVVVLSKKQLLKYAQKVSITKDNWEDYFTNDPRTVTETTTNEFGDENTTVTEVSHVFRVKDQYFVAAYENVAFKFAEADEYYYDKYQDVYYQWHYYIDENGKTVWVDTRQPDFIQELETEYGCYYYKYDGKIRDYFSHSYGNCIDAAGEMILFEIPDELWTEKTDFSAQNGTWYNGTYQYIYLKDGDTFYAFRKGETDNSISDLAFLFE